MVKIDEKINTLSNICDMHTHTLCSHDSQNLPEQSCLAALDMGLGGIAFTDHADIEFCHNVDVAAQIKRSVMFAEDMRTKYGDKLVVMRGVEIGEGVWHKDADESLLASCKFDVVVRSVHAVRFDGDDGPYSAIDFSSWSDARLRDYMRQYFCDVVQTVAELPCDVVAHLTCPLRYINGKYGRNVDTTDFAEQIDEILDTIVTKSLALEVNTSNLYDCGSGLLMPDEQILRRYYAMGGRLVTVGSDAHIAERVGLKFAQTLDLLRNIGFDAVYRYDNHKPIACRI